MAIYENDGITQEYAMASYIKEFKLTIKHITTYVG
jgi:hypothetical protein